MALPAAWPVRSRIFRYSPGLQALNEAEVVWVEENFATYIQDPTGYIRETAGDDGLRGSMAAQRMRGDTDAGRSLRLPGVAGGGISTASEGMTSRRAGASGGPPFFNCPFP